MRRLLTRVPVVLLLMLGIASPADASLADLLDKIGELSGPGPFKNKFPGSAAIFDFACFETRWSGEMPSVVVAPDFTRVRDQVLTVLGDDARNPFAIAALITNYSNPQQNDQQVTLNANQTSALRTLFVAQPIALEIARQQAQLALWQIAEEVATSTQKPEQALAEALSRRKIAIRTLDDATAQQYKDTVFATFNWNCSGDLRQTRRSIGFYAAWLVSDDVPSDYVYRPEVASLSARTNAVPLALTFKTSVPGLTRKDVLRAWDLGASVGRIIFFGQRFKRFNVWYVEVPRVTFRPFAHIACSSANECPGNWTWWDVFEMEAVVKWIPGIEASRFGAFGPTSDYHAQWMVRVGGSYKFVTPRPVKLVSPPKG